MQMKIFNNIIELTYVNVTLSMLKFATRVAGRECSQHSLDAGNMLSYGDYLFVFFIPPWK